MTLERLAEIEQSKWVLERMCPYDEELLTALREAQEGVEGLRKGYAELRQSMRCEFAALGVPSNPAWSDSDFPRAIAKIGHERDTLQRRVEALEALREGK